MPLSTPTGAGNVTTASGGAVASLTLNKPANVADADLLVAAVYFRNSGGTITPPAGWTLIGPANTVNETFAMFYKAVPSASAESATTYAFSTSAGSSRAVGAIVRVLGANLSSVFDAAGALAPYTGTVSTVLPAVPAVSGYTLLLGMAITNNATTGAPSLFTAPVTMTTLVSANADNGTSATAGLWVGAQVLSAAGDTGTRTPTISPTASNSGGLMVTITGIPVVAPASAVRPSAVLSSTGWSANTGTILAAVSDNVDSTYAQSATLTSTNVTLRVQMAEMVPATGGLNLRVRCALDVSATTIATAKLYQGVTQIKSWSIAPDSLQDFTLNATASDVSTVTNWAALEVQIDCKI